MVSGRDKGELSTINTARFSGRDLPPGAVSVRVIHDTLVTTRVLNAGQSVVVGRSRDVGLHVPHASISRRHAVIHTGPPLEIEDLGSANGTRVGGRVLHAGERAAIGPGTVVEIGEVVIVLQATGAASSSIVTTADRGMQPVLDAAARVAVSKINVLLIGETGVGKEVMAARIHDLSPRRDKPFVRLNCAAFAENLLASELFGHEKGAFSGADQAKPGLFEMADGGTVLLDEVGELPQQLQAKLLRVFEDQSVLRVGGLKPRPIDVRFIAATNRDLDQEIERGTFRRDLFFRLDGFSIEIPPLRERKGEIATLARTFAADAAREQGRSSAPTFSGSALAKLEAHAWPGNVRELRNVIGRALLLCTGAEIGPEHLPLERTPRASVQPPPVAELPDPSVPASTSEGDLRDRLAALEEERILGVLTECAGNQTQAAKLLGMSRNTLARRLEAFGAPRPRKRK